MFDLGNELVGLKVFVDSGTFDYLVSGVRVLVTNDPDTYAASTEKVRSVLVDLGLLPAILVNDILNPMPTVVVGVNVGGILKLVDFRKSLSDTELAMLATEFE